MQISIILFTLGGLIVSILVALAFTGFNFGGRTSLARGNIRSMVAAQRNVADVKKSEIKRKTISDTVAEEKAVKSAGDSRLTFRKKLKFAQWQTVPPSVFFLSMGGISLIVFLFVYQFFGPLLQIISLTSGPLAVNTAIMFRVNQRFKKFDKDYPQFLLSLVGLLKTGMNPIQALEAASSGMPPDSLVKLEVDLMLERLRLGVPEDRSIGSFGEDVNHPEIELFVQALLLSRRVGGNLSDTLDRLAKQVRKRQFFRDAAKAAVGLQRGSIGIIILILAGMQLFLAVVWPDVIFDTWRSPAGRMTLEVSISLMLLGLFWVAQVTKIKT